MKRVLVCSPKGGVGKTHFVRNLAVAAAHEGYRAATADVDPQEALTRWFARRPADLPSGPHYPVTWDEVPLLASGEGMEGADVLFIDTPPSLHEYQDQMALLLSSADLILVPTQPSFDDIDSLRPYVSMVVGRGLRPVIVLNAVRPQVNIAHEKAALVEVAELCPIEVADRVDYKRIGVRGLGICDLGKHAGVAEITALWRFVRSRVGLPKAASEEGRSGAKRRAAPAELAVSP